MKSAKIRGHPEYFMAENSHLSEAWHRPDGFSVRLGPCDVWQWNSSGLADNFGSRRVAEVNIVRRLLDEHRTRCVCLTKYWRKNTKITFYQFLNYSTNLTVGRGCLVGGQLWAIPPPCWDWERQQGLERQNIKTKSLNIVSLNKIITHITHCTALAAQNCN